MKILRAAVFLFALYGSVVWAQTPPVISGLSDNQAVVEGQSVTLQVVATGSGTLTYQWAKDGAAVTGATASTYVIAQVALADAGSYTVTVTNGGGSTTSAATSLTVSAAAAPSVRISGNSPIELQVGDTLTIYLRVSGSEPLSYVWKKDGQTVATTSAAQYSWPNVQLSDAGNYTVTASNRAGEATTDPVAVYVLSTTGLPVFELSPTGGTYDAGLPLYLTAKAGSVSAVSYQWYKDGAAIAGATSATYSVPNVMPANSGSYTVVATNANGKTTSTAATITVRTPVAPSGISIVASPYQYPVQPTTFFQAGSYLNLVSTVSHGTAPLTYQWRKNGVAITGATNSDYGPSLVQATDGGVYSLVVGNAQGTAISDPLVITVANPTTPIILQNPESETVAPGSYVTPSVTAVGAGSLQYQWYRNNVEIPGATSVAISVPAPTDPKQIDVYTVVVTNAAGSVTSQPAKIACLVPAAPVFGSQPGDMHVVSGQTFSLTAYATGSPVPTYQWYKDGVAIPLAVDYNYTVSPASADDAGVYTLVATNSGGSTTTRAVTVTVVQPTPPVIAIQPAGVSALANGPFSVGVVLVKDQGDTYQWYLNGQPLQGATDSGISVWYAGSANAGTYHVVVTNAAGSVTSNDVVVTVDTVATQPVIVGSSSSMLVRGGEPTQLWVQLASTVSAYSVVWKKDGVAVPNATSLTLNLDSFDVTQAGTYTAEITVSGKTYTSAAMVLDVMNKGALPTATIDPGDITLTTGTPQVLIAHVAGEFPITYQWKKNGVTIIGATASEYTAVAGAAGASDVYTLVATNRNGSASSPGVTIKATAASTATAQAPILLVQPQSQTAYANATSSVLLSVQDDSSTTAYAYQWNKDGAAIAGATSPTYSATTSGHYTVTVTNATGSTTSDAAVVTFISQATGPSFTTQPAAQTAYAGDAAVFTAAATGAGTITYQWLKDGAAIAGATNANLVRQTVATADAGQYAVIAFDANGSAVSASAALSVLAPAAPTITAQPQPQFVTVGQSATFSVTANGGPGLTYQWRKDGAAITGATTSTLTLTNLAKSDAATISVVVTDAVGSVTSDNAALEIFDLPPVAPAITAQSSSHAYAPGESVTLQVTASGSPSPTLQWYKNHAAITGATSAQFALGKMSAALAGDYYAVATNDVGSAQSATITLTLAPSPYTGTYFGDFTGQTGHWVLIVNTDGTGELLAYLPSRHSAVKTELFVDSDGTFTVTGTEIVPASVGSTVHALSIDANESRATATAGNFTLSGQITSGHLSGQFTEYGLTLSGAVDTGTGTTQTYTATALGTVSGTTYVIVGPSGQAIVITTSSAGVEGATGMVDSGGNLAATTSGGSQLAVTVNANSGSVSATITPSGSSTAISYAGLSDAVPAWKRLVNISSRANSGTGNNVAIGGFVIAGSGTKRVLIRAVGPTLNSQGIPVGEQMVDPTIVLHDILHGSTVIANADNWNDGTGGPAIAALADQVGAAALSAGDATSSAVILDLAPGVYSFIAEGKNQTKGIVLIEVYDADATTSSATLSNISTRANCAQGDSVAIGGFVVSGNAPKTVLVRAVGPTLTTQGLTTGEVLHDPTVEVHDVLHGQKIIATNDNWTDNANSAAITAAAARLGATPLDQADTTSSAMLLTLNPGVYSFVVNGKNGTSGIVLIEVYDAD